ncbi:ArsR/SmtB family transcription factor [Pseudoroseicyclus aestuarii]|uniref:ArsR family transcriptional regulator n=1 Tax=Pseudoroseicyclus aestuarii TaxID=1795041 RepID=A0A318SPX1_9RHOB|nr:metalloregulator ArsR/SmtB family transcription factor [Pseudoroseicyclus aestuarii]PYE83743.1 ArsR family transcriptional regulator [Pseudoroseicyclus aestuarii]
MALEEIPVEMLAKRADRVASRLSHLANARRLLIMCELSRGERTVGALQAAVGLGQSALSQHLARLRAAGMVTTRREGRAIYYRIEDPEVQRILSALCAAFADDAGRPATGAGAAS